MIKVISTSGDEYSCICPFHEDTNPSLSVNIKKGLALCFAGCFEGSIVSLVAREQRIPRIIAWRKVISSEKIFDFDGQKPRKYKTGYCGSSVVDIKWLPGDYTKYLINRGFARSTIRYWDIEYSPDIKHIRIPVYSRDNKLLSYSYRTIEPDIEPKYLHPGLKKKEGYLFGENIFERQDGWVNLVEGALDCIWMWQNGYQNTLAFLGSPCKEQINKMFSFGNKFKLCLDNDEGGEKETEKIIKVLKEKECDFSILDLPEGRDVQDLKSDDLYLAMHK